MEHFNTDWDPYEELLQHRHNIIECATAINAGSEVLKDLTNKYLHQQQIIQQLQHQNQRLDCKIRILQDQINMPNSPV